ncbi:MAG: GNAT family N-acetyltransferase [Candidatus Altiarchaeota archaeon]
MSLKGLKAIFSPKTVAVIGASNDKGSVGYSLMANLLGRGYEGTVYPVNLKRDSIQGVHAYKNIGDVPRKVDLAVIATPAKTVPQIVEECGQAGVKGVVVISAGFKEIGKKGKELEKEISKILKKYDMRLIGPNCLGVINPRLKMNASFAIKMPNEGSVAFISQSGALCSSVIDWAESRNIGFSYFVSVGSMLDIEFGDLIDFFGQDPQTSSIVIYLESIKNAKKFMSAASGFSLQKPIIVAKSGRFEEGRRAVVSHTGAIAGFDEVYSAAFKRAGVVRVKEVAELFDTAEKLAMGLLPKGPNIAIVTNAGGPGVMATDKIIEAGGKIAPLSESTINVLNSKLHPGRSHGNPIDVLGDAGPEEYRVAVLACVADKNVENIVVILTPQAGTDTIAVAKAVYDAWTGSNKPITACFMGGKTIEAATEYLRKKKIPTYNTPEEAIRPLLFGYEYSHNLILLHETPEEISEGVNPDRDKLDKIIEEHYETGELVLSERESKEFLRQYGIRTKEMFLASKKEEALKAAKKIGYPVVMKIDSPDITHKTDAGCVILSIHSDREVKEAFDRIISNAKKFNPKARINGVTVAEMVEARGFEVLLGAKRDDVFGEVIVLGAGGTLVEFLMDKGIGLPPMNQTFAKRMMEETRYYELLKKGSRDRLPANLKEIERAVIHFSRMIVDNPQLEEVDINPLLCTPNFALALDARIILSKKRDQKLHSHLCITPYPRNLIEGWVMKTGEKVNLRPIKAEDEPKMKALFKSFSEKTIRYRFFHPIKEFTHEMLIRYCHIDYDREIAIVAEKGGKLLGVGRLMIESTGESAEWAVVVTDAWQNKGLGTKLVSKVVGLARKKGLKSVYATVIKENKAMTHVAKKLGFIEKPTEDPDILHLVLEFKERNK